MKITIVGYKKEAKFAQGVAIDEDADLIQFLQGKGLNVVPTIWNDESVDWNNFDVAIIKSTWDYHNYLPDFLNWIDRIQNLGIKLLNPVDIIKWNSHKKYLNDISKKGLPVISGEYMITGSSFDKDYFQLLGAYKLVVKPCVSAGAQNTITLTKDNLQERKDIITELLKTEDYIVQPFVTEIQNGEWSFLFFNGKYSHCALKTPKQGDFRVQHYHGGSISYPKANPKFINQAQQYVDALPEQTLFARVDGVLINNEFYLMELELIEPYLFLNSNPVLLENYYKALMKCITK